MLHVNRKLYCGANWFSITHALAVEYCQSHAALLKKVRWTISSDEYVLQTFYKTMASGNYELYAQTKAPWDYGGTARLIDWKRGNPYVWRMSDYEELINSNRMFARKFNWDTDPEIIRKIVEQMAEF